jgi:hypothetical protein
MVHMVSIEMYIVPIIVDVGTKYCRNSESSGNEEETYSKCRLVFY